MPLPIVTYVGAPGEANRLTVARAGREITLTDPAATIAAEAPCRALDAHTASCDGGKPTPEGADSVAVQLGDGPDSVAVAPGLGIVARLFGADGDDVLTGGDEDDTIDGGTGADRVDGGEGIDVLSFVGRSAGVTADVAAGRTSDGDVFSGFEVIWGGDGPDRLLGGPGPDILTGGRGADTVRGAGGEDTLNGDLGADRLDGGAGDDELSGDPPQGDDYYTPIIKLRPDVLHGGPGDDTLLDSGGANVLAGDSGDDLLVGGAGPDRLLGGSGADRLFGHGGRDLLNGGAGSDRLFGEQGSDFVAGGKGADRLSGGAGADRLSARDRRRDRVECGRGRDTARIDAEDRVHACEILRPRGYTSSG